MPLVLKIILFVIGGLYAIRLILAFVRFLFKWIPSNLTKNVEIELTCRHTIERDNNYYYLEISAPFYDESHWTYFSFGFKGFIFAFVPIETIPSVLSKMLRSKTLYQTKRDWNKPSVSLSHQRIELSPSGTEVVEGLLVYNPQAIKDDLLRRYGFSDGADLFFISDHEVEERKIESYPDISTEWEREDLPSRLLSQRAFFESEGELIKIIDGWSIIHKDHAFIHDFQIELMKALGDKAIKKAGLQGQCQPTPELSKIIIDEDGTQKIKVSVKKESLEYRTNQTVINVPFR